MDKAIAQYAGSVSRRLHCSHFKRWEIKREIMLHLAQNESSDTLTRDDCQEIFGDPKLLARQYRLSMPIFSRLRPYLLVPLILTAFVCVIKLCLIAATFPTFDQIEGTLDPIDERDIYAISNSETELVNVGVANWLFQAWNLTKKGNTLGSILSADRLPESVRQRVTNGQLEALNPYQVKKGYTTSRYPDRRYLVTCSYNKGCANDAKFILLTESSVCISMGSEVVSWFNQLKIEYLDQDGKTLRSRIATKYAEGAEYAEGEPGVYYLLLFLSLFLATTTFLLYEIFGLMAFFIARLRRSNDLRSV